MSSTKLWVLQALDTLFFRDGSPFNAGEGGFTSVSSTFPPMMSTLQGAVRTALAYGQGWRPEHGASFPRQLGDHQDIGELVLRGPYVQWRNRTLFPVPLSLMRSKDGQTVQYTRLEPGKESIHCDLGHKRLPQPVTRLRGAKVLEQAYIDREGLSSLLSEAYPTDGQIKEAGELWHSEYRVGIERDKDTRTAVDRKLYNAVHVRPGKEVAVTLLVSGIPDEWHAQVAPVFSLGGEGRLVHVTIMDERELLPSMPELEIKNGLVRFTIMLVTPAKFADVAATRDAIINGPPGVPGCCIAGCIGKVRQVGGWNLKNKKPRPLEPFLPAGSIWFYEAQAEEVALITALHGQLVGEKTNYGYGQVVVGKWGGSV
ncbi:hypothetical protein GTO89_03180 [Heliobacterium gestii]|uniref:Type III-B CRISPR module-associated protein Cmr3 n=1 Tax=Heliomicrobium gestii TaxID=2699 RepID=A0A845L733_HELGE|nr:type III-B CRISPR module-associated protein Cmr3 [Heliomicrobium gestii]MBM7865793.1 CRISPR-associated protein Cmr3 [Heliomicrobium gestii]MZP42038.1 hypothetical protein [Heliomicrobium gestii]